MALKVQKIKLFSNIEQQDVYSRIEYFHINKKLIDVLDDEGEPTGEKEVNYQAKVRVDFYTSEAIANQDSDEPIKSVYIDFEDFNVQTLFTKLYKEVKKEEMFISSIDC